MSSFIPHYYNNYYFQNYYNAVQQRDKYRYDREYQRPQPHYGSYYQTQPRYQTSFFANPAYSSTHFNQYDVNRSALAYANQYDDRYRPRHTWPYLDHGHQRKAWKYPDSALPLSNYSRRYSSIDDDGQVYQFEREIRFIPYPVYVRPGGSAITSSAYLGYHNPVGHQFPLWTNTSYPIRSNASQLTPKIRVIFIPPPATFQPPACPPSLCMPPFLFNRMAQPFCSLPVPPPLPQISSLPLSLGVQQRVMQQYANPVAVLPWNNAWSSAISQPPMMPMFQMPQIPQIPQQPMMLMPPLPSQYTPAVSFPQFQPLPAPAPIPQYQPMPAAAPIQPIYPSPIAPASQPAAGAYPDICRACIPAPPPLNISVNGHCWVQHCSACHLVPGDVSNPNARPPTGRMTPLLRQPTALPNASHGNQGAAASHAGHVNGLPPLPPGAVLISDEYVDRNAAQPSRPRPSLQQASYSYTAPHPSKVSTYSTHKSRGQAPVQPPNHVVKPSPPSSGQQSRGTPQVIMSAAPLTLSANRHHSVSPSSSYTSGTSSSQTPIHVHGAPAEPNPAEKERRIVFRQVGASTRTVNVQYRHQTPDVHSIYQSNEQSTSVESDGTANELSRSGSSFASHERSTPRNRSPSVPLASSEEHEGEEKLAADESSAPASTKQARSYLTAVYNVQSLSLWNDGSDLADAATTNEDQARAVVEDVVDSD